MKRFFAVLVCVCMVLLIIPFSASASVAKVIDSIVLTNVPTASVGAAPKTAGISPSGTGYSVSSVTWTDITTHTTNFKKFEQGHSYELRIILENDEGYRFDNCPILTVNGKTVDTSCYRFIGEQIWVELVYRFGTAIKEISLPEFKESVAVGDPIPKIEIYYPNTQIVYADGYRYYQEWFPVLAHDFPSDISTFQNGYLYACEYRIGCEEGYYFDENLIIKVGGKVYNSIHNEIDHRYGSAKVSKIYNLSNLQPITSINITTVPVEEGTTINSSICSVDSNGCTVEDFNWQTSKGGAVLRSAELANSPICRYPAAGNFKQGYYYSASGKLKAKAGYYFDESLKITVNGKPVKLTPFYLGGLCSPPTTTVLGLVFDCTFDDLVKKDTQSVSSTTQSTVETSSEQQNSDSIVLEPLKNTSSVTSPVNDGEQNNSNGGGGGNEPTFPTIPVAVGAGVIVLGAGTAVLVIRKKKVK